MGLSMSVQTQVSARERDARTRQQSTAFAGSYCREECHPSKHLNDSSAPAVACLAPHVVLTGVWRDLAVSEQSWHILLTMRKHHDVLHA